MGNYKWPADNNDLVDRIDDVELDYLGFFINYVNKLAKTRALVYGVQEKTSISPLLPSFQFESADLYDR